VGTPTWEWHLPLDIPKKSHFPLWEASGIVATCRSKSHSVSDRVGNFIGLFSNFCVEKPSERVKTMFFCLYDVHDNFMKTLPLMKVSKIDENIVNSRK
jgi:hypothetical protein